MCPSLQLCWVVPPGERVSCKARNKNRGGCSNKSQRTAIHGDVNQFGLLAKVKPKVLATEEEAIVVMIVVLVVEVMGLGLVETVVEVPLEFLTATVELGVLTAPEITATKVSSAKAATTKAISGLSGRRSQRHEGQGNHGDDSVENTIHDTDS